MKLHYQAQLTRHNPQPHVFKFTFVPFSAIRFLSKPHVSLMCHKYGNILGGA